MIDAGRACGAYHDDHVRNLGTRRVQVDEIWSSTALRPPVFEAIVDPAIGLVQIGEDRRQHGVRRTSESRLQKPAAGVFVVSRVGQVHEDGHESSIFKDEKPGRVIFAASIKQDGLQRKCHFE